jgi:TorA maturation chaperone TorD
MDRENINLKVKDLFLLSKHAEDRSRIYMLLSIFYCQRPGEEFIKKLKNNKFIQSINNALSSENEDIIKDGLKLLEMFINSLKDLPDAQTAENLSIDFTRLFRGIKKGYGPPPPYESIWRGEGRVMGQWTEKVLKEYAYSGIGMDLSDELPDYIGIELKFVALLCYKEAEAWRNNDSIMALRLLNKEQEFIDEHLKIWIPKFCTIMAREARSSLYKGIAILTKRFIEIESEKKDWIGSEN